MAQRPIDSGAYSAKTKTHDIPATGKLDRETFLDEFEIIDGSRGIKELAATEAFYEEEVEVVVSESDNPNLEQLIQVGVNGTNQFFIRGVPVIVKRKFLEGLCRARPESITTQEYLDANGNRSTRVIKTPGLKFPFRVLRDSNPRGREWLEKLLQEG